MSIQRSTFFVAALVVSACLMSAQAWAQSQTAGSIAGSVKDATGAVLPGVTVEASSPALIEKTRAAVTDGQGNYKILDLRPGTYTVTFTLPGFATFKRDGLALTTGFTANVNAEMRVGAVSETVTVTGASPVVDVQNVRQQLVLTRELVDALPIGKTLHTISALTLGSTVSASSQDVGGTKGDNTSGNGAFSYHGLSSNDSVLVVEGMVIQGQSTGGGPAVRSTHQNQLAFEETTIGSGVSAEQEVAGLMLNLIPRDGGNVFSGTFALNGSSARLQSSNLTPELVARGVPKASEIKKLYDVGGGLGGPIKRDRLWFYYSDRWWNAENTVAGSFFNATPQPAFGFLPIYTPDLGRPAATGTPHHNDNLRLTWQMTTAQKLAFFTEIQSSCQCYRGATSTRAPETAQHGRTPWGKSDVFQETWNYVKGNRWLFSVGNSSYVSFGTGRGFRRTDETSPTAIPLQDLNTGFVWNAAGDDPFPFGTCCMPYADDRVTAQVYSHDQKYSATYSTGSHTFKVGGRTNEYKSGGGSGTGAYNITPFGAVALQVRGGTLGVRPVPASVLQLISPLGPLSSSENAGTYHGFVSALYAQEQWSLHRMTLNLGVRYDGMHGSYDAYTTVPSEYLPSQTLPAVANSPNWRDIAPRIGVAYDVFGNGKTALKGSWGRFVVHATEAGASPTSQFGFGGGTRTWNDRNGNFAPECDYKNPLANGECGPLPNVNRGLATAQSRFFDPAYLTGWGNRPYIWSSTLSLQHELWPGVSANVAYYRTTQANQTVTDNRAVVPADYSPYCVTAPVDARLGSVSGSQLCGLSDLNPSKFGQVNNLVTTASVLGVHRSDTYNGLEFSTNARFGNGGVLQGGVSTAQTVDDNCSTVDAPARPGYCRTVGTWSQNIQVKLFGAYPLPWWQLRVSGTLQNLPGYAVGANRRYTSAQIAPSLGRPLSAGATGTVSIPLLPPNTLFESRFNQMDVRLSKAIRISRLRAEAQVDAYNVFNSSAVLGANGTYGAAWLRPTSILGARVLKFGVQVDWK